MGNDGVQKAAMDSEHLTLRSEEENYQYDNEHNQYITETAQGASDQNFNYDFQMADENSPFPATER